MAETMAPPRDFRSFSVIQKLVGLIHFLDIVFFE